MRTDTIETFLAQLAAKVPAPGGGATAALHAAQAAALVGMVARYSDGARFAAHAEEIGAIAGTAERLREEALGLAEDDVAAAAEAARAAATTARVDVEINLAGITAADLRRDLVRATAAVDDLARRAEQLTTAVRDGLAR